MAGVDLAQGRTGGDEVQEGRRGLVIESVR